MSRRANFGGQLTSPDSSSAPSLLTTSSLPPGLEPSSAADNSGVDTPPQGKHNPNKGKQKAAAAAVAANKKLTAAAAAPNPEAGASGERECFLCAEEATYWAVGECGHRTCDVCAVRMRALYKKTECSFCKTECPRVVFTASSTKTFAELPPASTPFSDSKLGLAFETREQMDAALSLLRFNCPVQTPACEHISTGWADLKRHIRTDHGRALCDLCVANKKVFADEHIAYAPKELSKHVEKDHAACGFCHRNFFDDDALLKHCRDQHEECFICVRQGIRYQYHLNYAQLEQHFRLAHFMCPHPTCLAEKFIVFESELDLQAHAVDAHGAAGPSGGDQRARLAARRIETNFTVVGDPSGGRSNRRPGRAGRMEEIEPVQASFLHTPDGAPRTANGARVVPGLGPSQGGGGSRQARFNGGLTEREAPPHQRNGNGNGNGEQQQRASQAQSAALAQAEAEKHAALLRRVQAVVNSDNKVTSFKHSVKAYKANESSASDLVDQLWNIFDQNEDTCNGVVMSVAELFGEGDKRTELLSAWRDHRSQINAFPSLSGLATPLPSASGYAPARSANRNPNGTNTNWTRGVEPAPSSSSAPARERFPALPGSNPTASGGRQVPGMRGAPSTTRVLGSTPWAGSASVAPRPMIVPARPAPHSQAAPIRATAPTVVRRQEFPSLPTNNTENERRARMKAALAKPGQNVADSFPSLGAGGASGSRTPEGGWGAGSSASSSAGEVTPSSSAQVPIAGGGGQKKKKGKVLLMTQGAVHRG